MSYPIADIEGIGSVYAQKLTPGLRKPCEH